MSSRSSRLRFSFAAVILAALVTALPLVRADSGANHQTEQTEPISLGTSGGNVNNISNAFCCSGTLGSLVTKGGVDYILSNNHVLADSNTGQIGDEISQPGLVDVSCDASQAQIVATLSEWIPLGTGNVDAALAAIVGGAVKTDGSILDIGKPSTTTASIGASTIGQGVAKSGRTTGLTCSNISSISTNVKVQYQQGCNSGKKFTVTYTNQIVVGGSGFSAGGDSGSLIVTSDNAQPIGLLYAGSSTDTIGNRIGDVTSALGVSFVGGGNHAVTCPTQGGGNGHHGHGKPSQASFGLAMAAKQANAHRLMADPAVLGVGVGASANDPSQAVVVVYVEQGRSHAPIPPQLDGVRTRIVRTDAFRAYGWNETRHPACSLR
jgi:hypothetical protein